MTVVDVKELASELPGLLARVRAGEEVVISDAGQPVARVLPATETSTTPREFGHFKGRVWIADDFNDPLPPEVQTGFEK